MSHHHCQWDGGPYAAEFDSTSSSTGMLASHHSSAVFVPSFTTTSFSPASASPSLRDSFSPRSCGYSSTTSPFHFRQQMSPPQLEHPFVTQGPASRSLFLDTSDDKGEAKEPPPLHYHHVHRQPYHAQQWHGQCRQPAPVPMLLNCRHASLPPAKRPRVVEELVSRDTVYERGAEREQVDLAACTECHIGCHTHQHLLLQQRPRSHYPHVQHRLQQSRNWEGLMGSASSPSFSAAASFPLDNRPSQNQHYANYIEHTHAGSVLHSPSPQSILPDSDTEDAPASPHDSLSSNSRDFPSRSMTPVSISAPSLSSPASLSSLSPISSIPLVHCLRIPESFVLYERSQHNAWPFLLLVYIVHGVTGQVCAYPTSLRTPLLPGYDSDEEKPSTEHLLLSWNQSILGLDDLARPAQWLAKGCSDKVAKSFQSVLGRPYQSSIPFARKFRSMAGIVREDGRGCPVAEVVNDVELYDRQRQHHPVTVAITPRLKQDCVLDNRNRTFAVLHPTREYDVQVCGAYAAEWDLARISLLWAAPGNAAEDGNQKRLKLWPIWRPVSVRQENAVVPPVPSSTDESESESDDETEDESEDDDPAEMQRLITMLQKEQQEVVKAASPSTFSNAPPAPQTHNEPRAASPPSTLPAALQSQEEDEQYLDGEDDVSEADQHLTEDGRLPRDDLVVDQPDTPTSSVGRNETLNVVDGSDTTAEKTDQEEAARIASTVVASTQAGVAHVEDAQDSTDQLSELMTNTTMQDDVSASSKEPSN